MAEPQPTPEATRGGDRRLAVIGVTIGGVGAVLAAVAIVAALLSDRISDISVAIQSESTKRESSMVAITERIDRLMEKAVQLTENVDGLPERVNTVIAEKYFPLWSIGNSNPSEDGPTTEAQAVEASPQTIVAPVSAYEEAVAVRVEADASVLELPVPSSGQAEWSIVPREAPEAATEEAPE